MIVSYPRDLIRIVVRDAEGDEVSDAYWSDVGTRQIQVVDPETGGLREYTFHGAGQLIEVSPIPSVSGMTVQSVSLRLSQIDDRVNDLLRGYELRGAPVTIWRGYLGDDGRFTAPAEVLFHGTLDYVDIQTPEAGGEGGILGEVVSVTEALTRTSPATRSGTPFFKDAAVVGDWEINWGAEKKRLNG